MIKYIRYQNLNKAYNLSGRNFGKKIDTQMLFATTFSGLSTEYLVDKFTKFKMRVLKTKVV